MGEINKTNEKSANYHMHNFLSKLEQEPNYELRIELTKLLQKPLNSFSINERKRYYQLLELLKV